MARTGLSLEKINFFLELNAEVRTYLTNKYPTDFRVNWYVAGVEEEYIRLMFRLPEGVKNIDLDCVEIRSRKGIVAFIEFKRKLLESSSKKQICTYAAKQVMLQLERSMNTPCYVLRFDSSFQKFQIFRISDSEHNYDSFTFEEINNWRRNLTNGPCLPQSKKQESNVSDFMR